MKITAILFFLLIPYLSEADFYQYNTSTLDITGSTQFDTFDVAGHAYFNSPDALPVPSGCTSGRLEWSRVNRHPNPSAIVLKTELVLFQCEQVSSGDEVDAIVERESKALCDSLPQPDPLLTQLLADIDRLCVADSADQDCIDARTAYTAIATARARTSVDDHADAKRVAEAIQTLHTEAATFKSGQGW